MPPAKVDERRSPALASAKSASAAIFGAQERERERCFLKSASANQRS
jgi:hypothetical protein